MRSEKEVISQLLRYAELDARVKVVLLNGSRVNPKVSKDILCDYDVIFGVMDTNSFVENQEWISKFGELIIMQHNTIQEDAEDWPIFLMLFTDGVRVDLSIRKTEQIIEPADSLTKVLLDKENLMGIIEPASDRSYVTNKPSKEQYDEALNEIWWCSTNVAKGLWRGELPYAKYMLDVVVRDAVVTLLSWYIGMNNGWNINTGKAGRWLERFLPGDVWTAFAKTYVGGDPEHNWNALLETGELVRTVGKAVADGLGCDYPQAEDTKVTEYIIQLRKGSARENG
ncbi:aminoglycoside 6-adenylyltransferase [Cohnella silvisoli]|uniref:Aminoglycoside 6-adenylyltransferase n=1 Tax=Cohnella silvisoli TaxID=2873699 RepID=A0ABV1KSE9_9BACL|nr:aminoglycoside 6-adenylyltransferase [Cohnella silvisoli]MCD9022524.1 aminoglycoside 6-adenylyltransferase [Cohnella silvisoli]